jgi:hypothetical protein
VFFFVLISLATALLTPIVDGAHCSLVWLACGAGALIAFQNVSCYAWNLGLAFHRGFNHFIVMCCCISASVAHDARSVNTVPERAIGTTNVNIHGSHYAHCSLI